MTEVKELGIQHHEVSQKKSVYHCDRYLSVTVPILKKDTIKIYVRWHRNTVDEYK